jgi:hypothetical protein
MNIGTFNDILAFYKPIVKFFNRMLSKMNHAMRDDDERAHRSASDLTVERAFASVSRSCRAAQNLAVAR